MPTPLNIWSNVALKPAVAKMLDSGVAGHALVGPAQGQASNLVAGAPDPSFSLADVAFGQPHPDDVFRATRLKWVHLSSAGFTRYDTTQMREFAKSHDIAFTNSSSVFDEPCAQHLLGMILSLARHFPLALEDQLRGPTWRYLPIREKSVLLNGQTLLIVGYGAIGHRLTELLAPLRMNVIGFRRTPTGRELAPTRQLSELDEFLPRADHVVNILPDAPGTHLYFKAERFARMKPGACFYNIGRGSTVWQPDLIAALNSGHLAAAYLDVTHPEPLPKDDPMWTTPNLYITPHTAGGHTTEFERLVTHFSTNLSRFVRGEPLLDRIF